MSAEARGTLNWVEGKWNDNNATPTERLYRIRGGVSRGNARCSGVLRRFDLVFIPIRPDLASGVGVAC